MNPHLENDMVNKILLNKKGNSSNKKLFRCKSNFGMVSNLLVDAL